MKISILKHSCDAWNMVVLADSLRTDKDFEYNKCPFYFKRWNAHWFTFFGIRVIIGELR